MPGKKSQQAAWVSRLPNTPSCIARDRLWWATTTGHIQNCDIAKKVPVGIFQKYHLRWCLRRAHHKLLFFSVKAGSGKRLCSSVQNHNGHGSHPACPPSVLIAPGWGSGKRQKSSCSEFVSADYYYYFCFVLLKHQKLSFGCMLPINRSQAPSVLLQYVLCV